MMIDSIAAPMFMLADTAAATADSGVYALFSWQAAVALLTLTVLEIVLGVDNIIFIAIIAAKLPDAERAKARNLGLFLAMVQRVLLLLVIGWIIGLDQTLFSLFSRDFSGKDLILLAGGLFLIGKSVKEIHEKLEGDPTHGAKKRVAASLGGVLMQIILIDAVFSVDSILTAVGMVPPEHISIMIAAIIISGVVMIAAAGFIARFVEKHPTIKMLAIAILVMIGVLLVAEGLGQHFPRGYVYFAMAFSLVVEILNINSTKKRRKKAQRAAASAAPAEPFDG